MKITSSTSITSTSGTTLISASDVDTFIARARRPPARLGGCWIGSSFGIDKRAWALRKVAFRDGQEFEREIFHLVRKGFHAARQIVVEIHGRNRGEESERRRDQRFGNRRRDDAKARRSGGSDR